jgi:hypothetical protein
MKNVEEEQNAFKKVIHPGENIINFSHEIHKKYVERKEKSEYNFMNESKNS